MVCASSPGSSLEGKRNQPWGRVENEAFLYIPLTLIAAFGFAAAAVLQQAEASRQHSEGGAEASLLWKLVQQPLWLLGLLAYVAAYGFQVWAVSIGPIVVIQPLIAAQLVFSLILGTVILRRHPSRREWFGAATVTAGLAGFIVGTDPSPGNPDTSLGGWAVSIAAVGGLTGLAIFLAWRTTGGARSGWYGTAAGLAWGMMIVLMKTVTHHLDGYAGAGSAIVAMFEEGYIYGLVATALGGFALIQSAFQAGSLTHALVAYTICEIVVAVILGILLFGERPHSDIFSLLLTVVSSAVMIAGIVVLAGKAKVSSRSPSPPRH